MRSPRARFTVKRMMIGVAAMALLLWAGRAITNRPRPHIVTSTGVRYLVIWSDKTVTVSVPGAHRLAMKSTRLASLVRWPDGHVSVYLHPW